MESHEPKLHYTGMFNPYGSIRNIVSISDTGAEVQDDASRVGINFSTFGPIKVFGTAEWGVNLVQSETTFNAGASKMPIEAGIRVHLRPKLGSLWVKLRAGKPVKPTASTGFSPILAPSSN